MSFEDISIFEKKKKNIHIAGLIGVSTDHDGLEVVVVEGGRWVVVRQGCPARGDGI